MQNQNKNFQYFLGHFTLRQHKTFFVIYIDIQYEIEGIINTRICKQLTLDVQSNKNMIYPEQVTKISN